MGPASKLSTKTEEFETFVRTVRFAAEGSTPPIQWNAPSNWKAGKTNELRFATFLIDPEANPKLELTVIKLGKDAGSILANINRWRGQIQLAPASDADLATAITRFENSGLTFAVVDFENAQQRVLGAIIPVRGSTWFVKLTGPATELTKEKPAFLAFLKTVKPPSTP
jgi:hypothetical protein